MIFTITYIHVARRTLLTDLFQNTVFIRLSNHITGCLCHFHQTVGAAAFQEAIRRLC